MVIAVAAAIAAALATWSVDDPSWSHATTGPVRNVLGTTGAIVSDLVMQFIGLASVLIPLPLVFWGWRMVNGNGILPSRRMLTAWFLSLMFGAGVLACLPVSEAWPLPLGLGGVIGDWMIKLPLVLSGLVGEGAIRLVVGLGFAIVTAIFFFRAAGLSAGGMLRDAGRMRQSLKQRRARRTREATPIEAETAASFEEPDFEDDFHQADPDADLEEERNARLFSQVSTGLGALTHWTLSARAQMRRLMSKGSKVEYDSTWIARLRENLLDPDDGLDRYYDTEQQGAGTVEPYPGEYDDVEPSFDHPETDPPFDIDAAPAPAPARRQVSARPETPQQGDSDTRIKVSAKAPPPKPGKRIIREAQTTFLADPVEFEFPPLHLLSEPKAQKRDAVMSDAALAQNARILESVLEDFGVRGAIVNVRPGPVVTLYELEPAPGIKSSRVIGLADDIARSMSAISARVAVIPGKNAIGIELPNPRRETVYLRELLAAEHFEKSKAKLPMCLGKTIGGEPVIADLARMPHLLVAGTTGSGKSVAINTMIASLLYRLKPDQCKLIMVDPKMLELSVYDGIPHLLSPVVTDPKKAVVALKWTVREMEDRYKKMSKLGVRNIDGFNNRVRQAADKNEVITRTVQTGFDRETGEAIYEEEVLELAPMPYIVVIVDEMADLMIVAGKDIEGAIQRLAQMARAAGIHIIMATQRPSVDVITGTIKANFPTRISFQVTSKIDSRTILGEQGAEQLLGMGDMLYMAGGGRIQRVHGPFVSDDEVENIVTHLKNQGLPQYLEAITDEDSVPDTESGDGGTGGDGEGGDLYEQAVAIVLRDKKASTSYVQRRLSIGYNRAASIIERMEQEGLIGPANHAGKREILVGDGEEM